MFQSFECRRIAPCLAVRLAETEPRHMIIYVCPEGDLEGLYSGRIVAPCLHRSQETSLGNDGKDTPFRPHPPPSTPKR